MLPTARRSAAPTAWWARARLGPLAAGGGLIATIISLAGSWIPSFWGDEAASVMSARRTLPQLFEMLSTVDAVHGAYYLLLHGWVEMFGPSEFATRLPSAVAVGVAVAGVMVIAERLSGRSLAITAGVVAAVLPRVTLIGTEARSQAMAMALATWLTVLIVHLATGPRPGTRGGGGARLGWVGYALLLAAGVYLFLYLALMVLVHGLWLASRHSNRQSWLAWGAATCAGLLLAAPIIQTVITQRGQLDFLAYRPALTAFDVLIDQWFMSSWLAWPALALIGWGILALWRGRRADRPPGPAPRERSVLWLAGLWASVPLVILLSAGLVVGPIYALRHLAFTSGAIALLIGVGVVALPRPGFRVLAVLAVIALAVPSYLAQRTPTAKDGRDWRLVSEYLGEQARPGDGILFDEQARFVRQPRLAFRAYPQFYEGLVDVTLVRSYRERAALWDETVPLRDLTPAEASTRLQGIDTLWYLDYPGADLGAADLLPGPGDDLLRLTQLGFVVQEVTKFPATDVYELGRRPGQHR